MATVFYSWQADTATREGRSFVHKALEAAISELHADARVEDAHRETLELDSDTKGVAGSPPIVETIFKKIDAATVFVADMTFVGSRTDGRPMPNTNVSIEYGWAMKSLRYDRVIAVMNTAFGEPTSDSMPFDLRHLRWPIRYECRDSADHATRKAVRKQLVDELKEALRAVLALQAPQPAEARTFVPTAPMERSRFRNVVEAIGDLHHGGFTVGHVERQPVRLRGGACMWLRVMPVQSLSKELLSTRIEGVMRAGGRPRAALNFYNERFSAHGVRGPDGFGLCNSIADGLTDVVVYAFKSGEVWTIDTAYLSLAPDDILFDEKAFAAALVGCAAVLENLGVSAPYNWIAGMEGIEGRRLLIANQPATFPKPAAVASMVIDTGRYSGNASEATTALEAFFEKVYDNHQMTRT